MSKRQTPPTLESQQARTLPARAESIKVRTNHGLERYSLTLYLEPGQVEYLRGLESKQRSSVMSEALKLTLK